MIESRKAEKNKTNEQRNAREIVILLLLSELNYAFQHEPLMLKSLYSITYYVKSPIFVHKLDF